MAGTKRLAVGGPWHGRVIEPANDTYRRLPVDRGAFHYLPATVPFPTVSGQHAPMPILICDGYAPPVFVEVLDALVSAVWSATEVAEFAARDASHPSIETVHTRLVGADGNPL